MIPQFLLQTITYEQQAEREIALWKYVPAQLAFVKNSCKQHHSGKKKKEDKMSQNIKEERSSNFKEDEIKNGEEKKI